MYASPGPYQNQGPYHNTAMYPGHQPYGAGQQPYGGMGQPHHTIIGMDPMYRETHTYESNDNGSKWPWDSIDFAGTSFQEKAIRKKFISKVTVFFFT